MFVVMIEMAMNEENRFLLKYNHHHTTHLSLNVAYIKQAGDTNKEKKTRENKEQKGERNRDKW